MQDWTCLFSDKFSTEGMELQFFQYQHQSTPVPSTDKVCSAQRYRNIDLLGRRHEYNGGFPHEVSARDTWCMLVGSWHPTQRCFSDLVCQPLVTSYVMDAYLCLAMLDAWSLEYQHNDALRLMVDTYEGSKPMASWRRPTGRPHNVWLNKIQADANALLSTLWRSEIARNHGAAQRFTRTTRRWRLLWWWWWRM